MCQKAEDSHIVPQMQGPLFIILLLFNAEAVVPVLIIWLNELK